MKVVITNVVLSNTGDAAICLGIIDTFVRSGVVASTADVVIVDDNAEVTAALYPDLQVRQQPLVRRGGSRLQRVATLAGGLLAMALCRVLPASLAAKLPSPAVRAYAEADLVVSTGGTYLVEHYRIMALRLLELLFVPARTSVMLWTQSMGPFHRRSSRLLVRRVARRASAVLLRDEKSLRYLQEVAGSSEHFVLAIDAAFGLNVPAVDTSADRTGCVISVREWGLSLDGAALEGSQHYENAIVAAAAAVHRAYPAGWIRALSTCQGVPLYRNDDSALAARLFSDSAFVSVDREFHRPSELLDVLVHSRVVIATRMHMAILALLAGCQVVAIAYEFKTVELFTLLGLSDQVVALQDCTPQRLGDVVATMLADPSVGRLGPSEVERLARSAFPDHVRDTIKTIRR